MLSPFQQGGFGRVLLPSSGGVDPSFSSITLLAHMDGTNGGTTFTDSGPLARTMTPNGVTTSTTQSKFGGASAFCAGTSGFNIITSYATSPIGTGDFTIEYWVYPTTITGDYNPFSIVGASNAVNAFIGNDSAVSSGASVRFVIRNDAGTSNSDITASGTLVSANVWTHVACVADGSTARIYTGGVQRTSGSITGTRSATFLDLNLCRLTGGTPRTLNGYLEEVRVTKGVCRYPGGTTFTPQTAAFPNS